MSLHTRLAFVAAGLAALAALVGEPTAGGIPRALVESVARGEGRVSVVEVARWIKSRRSDLEVIDLQSEEDFNAFHLPTAVHASLSDLADRRPADGRTLVLYAGAGPLPAQAWLLLRARGVERVHYLERGVSDWIAAIDHPVLPDQPSEAELAAWAEIGELSRYFGGLPRRGGPRPAEGAPVWFEDPTGTARSAERAMVEKTRRRGCGF